MSGGLEAALACHALGLSVIPVRRDKKPLIEWREFQKKAATDSDIRKWWRQFPDANVGVVTGFLSGVFVLDVDGDLGAETLAQLQKQHGPLPRTWRSRTGRGEHIWFRFPPDELRNTAGEIAPGLDTRGEGGYVVAPGSVHASGAQYEWQDDGDPVLGAELAQLPDWLLDLVRKRPEPTPEPKVNGAHPPLDHQFRVLRQIFEDERNDLAKLFKGQRNTALNAAAFALGQLSHYGAWTEDEARAALQAACMANGLYYDAESGGEKACEATFASGWSAGCAAPRDINWRETHEQRRQERTMRHVEPSSYEAPDPEYQPDDWAKRINLETLHTIPPRQWLMGVKLIRGFTTLLVSPGGTGKTALTFGWALSCVTGETLLHDKPHRPLNVWLYNLEDPYDELRRRAAAALQYYGDRINPIDVEQRLFINSGRDRGLLIAERQGDDLVVTCPDAERLIAELQRMKIDVLMVDPFIMTHNVNENSNSEIEKVVREFNRIAGESNCAVGLVHHSRKGFVSGDQDSIRGGSAMVGAARAAYTMAQMTPEEAEKLNVPEDERRFLVRVDDAKMNMAPRSAKAQWIKLVSQNIGNGDDEYPHGDNVQVATLWEAPDHLDGLTIEIANEILDLLERGKDGDFYSIQRNAALPAIPLIQEVMERHGKPRQPRWAKDVINAWMSAKPPVVYEKEYTNSQRKERRGLFVNQSNRPGSERL